jgi:hypothetical protein
LQARFADGSCSDLTGIANQLLALGAHVAIERIGSVPVLHEALGDVQHTDGLDAVIAHNPEPTFGTVVLCGNLDALFVLHHVDGDELLTTEAALRLIAAAAAALIEDAA